ncbi:MAG: hypothetical protein RLZZ385_1442 [Pseudomonadota bacterium]|jgi:tetratricopeptide (TPR) repeat protein
MSLRTVFATVTCLCLLATSAQAADIPQVGTYDFPTSTTNAAAQEQFMLGVGYLHSFGTTQAQEAFRKAQELDPDFAMAYWGEAFTYQHPFFGAISDGPGEALMRLAPTPELRQAKAPNDKEKGFLKAAEAYALTPGGMPERRIAWNKAMEELYARYPDDYEVTAFYVVSTLAAAGHSGAMRERMNMKAGALALELFKKNDNHPGAAHYVIHAFDDPIHAPIALEAALKYRDIAPAVSHARHMPSHIFIQHGMWDEVANWNESAYQVARELWKPGDAVGEQNHATDWGQYGDLQRGDLARSELWIERARQTLAENPRDGRSIDTLKIVQSRHTIETRQWQLMELTDDLTLEQLLALGMSAAHLGELDLADRVAASLAARAAANPNNDNLQMVHAEVAALARAKRAETATGQVRESLQAEAKALLANAITVEESGILPNGAANPLKPVHELAGEIYLSFGEAAEAIDLFETLLLRLPNRPLSLLGAARAYVAAGEMDKAGDMYAKLLAIWSDESWPSVQEARQFVASR